MRDKQTESERERVRDKQTESERDRERGVPWGAVTPNTSWSLLTSDSEGKLAITSYPAWLGRDILHKVIADPDRWSNEGRQTITA